MEQQNKAGQGAAARSLTAGPITGTLLRFAVPMILGDLLQQMYNVADTLIVGQFVGADALAAVGSAYTLMTFLTSILLGLSMGAGVAVSISFGRHDADRMRSEVFLSFVMIAAVAAVINIGVFAGIDPILSLLQVPPEVWDLMREYLWAIFFGIGGTFLYNYYASMLRAVGDSVRPLFFLGFAAVLNVVLDLAFVLGLNAGVAGAAWATVISQWLSGIGLCIYALATRPDLRLRRQDLRWDGARAGHVFRLAFITGAQQSIMNFGILMVQGRVNSFGPAVMAAFAAAVKIDSFAYMPVQDFGNAYSTFIAQNYGAGQGGHQRGGVCAGPAADADLCAAHRDRGPGHRRAVPAHRGRFLLPDRPFVPAVRLLPRHRAPRYVGGAYRHLAGAAGGAGLRAVGHPGAGRGGHLGVHPHRLGHCRPGGLCAAGRFPAPAETGPGRSEMISTGPAGQQLRQGHFCTKCPQMSRFG